MKRFTTVAATMAVAIAANDAAIAQNTKPDDATFAELEVTMVLMPPGATRPDAVTKTIELPRPARDTGDDNSSKGQDTADEARENREDGLETAGNARERGREFGQEMAEQARENREDAGRGNAPDEPPGGPPDDLPTPPQP
ncbi:MAG TPA: hypothetical protein VLB07_12800 [Woeseiaceae bacterium]|nr:hypothetical protein [Woeseiaceae bacterium]